MDNILYDKGFRDKVRHLDRGSLTELVRSSIEDIDVKVVSNTKDRFYFVIPHNSDEEGLQNLQAAGNVGTAGTFATVGTMGTAGSLIGSTFSSFGSLGSLTSVGTADFK